MSASTRPIKLDEWGISWEEYKELTYFCLQYNRKKADAAALLPLGMTTRIVDKRNLRNLIDMSRQRMCNRAFWEFRELFSDICDALANYSEEWGWIVNNCFHEKCVELGYCPEKHGCGKYPKAGER